jgi:hypothetical protein
LTQWSSLYQGGLNRQYRCTSLLCSEY